MLPVIMQVRDKYLSIIKPLNAFLFLCFVASLHLPYHVPQVTIVVWAVSWLLEGRFLCKKKLCFGKQIIPTLILFVLFIWCCVSLLWSHDVKYGVTILPWFFGAIFIVSLFGVNEFYKSIYVKITFFVAGIIILFAYLFAIHLCIKKGLVHPIIMERMKTGIAFPFDISPINIKFRLFMGMNMVLCILCSKDVYTFFVKKFPKVYVLLTIIGIDLFFLYGLYATGSRAALLTGIALCFVSFCYHYTKRFKWLICALMLVVCIGGIVGLVHWHPRIQTLYSDAIVESKMDDKTIPLGGVEPRFYIHNLIITHIPDYGWKGLGMDGGEQYLREYYLSHEGLEHYAKTFYVIPHNQYFVYWMDLGPFAALLLLFFFIYTPFCYKKGVVRKWATYICVLWGLILCTEGLGQVDAMYLFSFSMLLLIVMYNEQERTQKSL